MRIIVFGLTISSSWGNGHATLWRSLCRGLGELGHEVVFFERDVHYYYANRDCLRPAGCDLRLYPSWESALGDAERALATADAAIVTSYCPDGAAASELVLGSEVPARLFYDMDAPVTLARLERGERIDYLPEGGLSGFDLVLSFTGDRALTALEARLGARRALPLYGSVDPAAYAPLAAEPRFEADLSYLGTYAADRQHLVEALLLEPARRLPERRFLIGGSLYPESIPWPGNVRRIDHVAPADHPAFQGSSRFVLNITRADMKASGHCPSGRLFEAAACGAPILTDRFEGLETFFEPGRELLVVESPEDVVAALAMPEGPRRLLGERARRRALADHAATRRALELVRLIELAALARRERPAAPSLPPGATAPGERARAPGLEASESMEEA